MSSSLNDPLWPSAKDWIAPAEAGASPGSELAIIGVPAYKSSITPTGAHATPGAVREALMRYSTFAASRGVDVSVLKAVDLGDVDDPDGLQGEERVWAAVEGARNNHQLVVALGGDNSITYSVMRGLFWEQPEAGLAGSLQGWGLITVDAHHDLRDGESNGSPVRRLIEAGLPGENIVQIGIADFSNSAPYAERAKEYGITVIHRDELRSHEIPQVIAQALGIAGRDGRPLFVDIDVDVCDRAEVPACPSAAPGGLSADELRQLVFLLARCRMVRGMDITEIDATADAADQRTVRLAALLVLEAAAGLCVRLKA